MLFQGWEAFGPLEGFRKLSDHSSPLGAMADAIHRASGERVLIKAVAITPDDRYFAQRFLKNQALFVELRHPCTLRTMDHGHRGNWAFRAVEGLDRPPQWIEKLLPAHGGRFPVALAVDVAAQFAGALQELNDRGYCYGNLHPRTTAILESGRALLVDFGRCVAKGTEATTFNSNVHYEAPEHLDLDMGATHFSEQYSLGALLYEMIAGKPPFAGLRPVKVARAKMKQSPNPLSEMIADLPCELDAIIGRSMNPNYTLRYPSLRDMEAALKALGDSLKET